MENYRKSGSISKTMIKSDSMSILISEKFCKYNIYAKLRNILSDSNLNIIYCVFKKFLTYDRLNFFFIQYVVIGNYNMTRDPGIEKVRVIGNTSRYIITLFRFSIGLLIFYFNKTKKS